MFIEYRISMGFMLAYMLLFLSLEYGTVQSLLTAAVSYILTSAMEAATFFGGYPPEMNAFLWVLEIMAVQMTAWVLSSYRDMRAIFTGVSAATYVLPGNLLYMGLSSFSWGEGSLWLLLAPVGVHLLILTISTCWMRERYLREMEAKSRLWNELWIVPAFFYGIIYMLTMWSQSFFKKWQNWVAIIMILLLMDIIFIFMIRVVYQLHDEEERRIGRELMEIYAEGLKNQIDTMKKSEEEFRIMRHDNKYRYHLIQNCLNEGKTEEIQKILDQTEDDFSTFRQRTFCNNTVLNGAIGIYCSRAEEAAVKFECQAQMPDPEQFRELNEFEFATIVMNLLDNAVRAATQVPEVEKRLVSLKIQPVKSQILLEVANTFTGEHKISRLTGLPLSDREGEHGFGMKSVQSYADKNHAIFQYSIKDEMFYVRLITNI